MDKSALLLVLIYSFLTAKVNGRSWHYNLPEEDFDADHSVVFDDYRNPRWHNTHGDFEESKHVVENDESGYKHPRKWNSDRVWFPDFSDSTGTPTTQPSQVGTTTTSQNIDDCIRECPTTSEYNPICGTNRVTYNNLGRLECARFCGVDVNIHRRLPCSQVSEDSSKPTSEGAPSVAEIQRQCQNLCPTTPEYNPVCGTNNVTYQNRGRLECAKTCGIDVEVKRLSPCPKPVTTESPITDDFFNPKDQAPWAISTNNNVFTQTTAVPEVPNVTISQEILNSIWNIPATDSNEFDIDIRLKE